MKCTNEVINNGMCDTNELYGYDTEDLQAFDIKFILNDIN